MTLSTLQTHEPADGRPARGAAHQAAGAGRRRRRASTRAGAAPAAGGRRGGAAPRPARRRAGVVDPMQWWGALTQQFTEIASKAMKDGAGKAQTGRRCEQPVPHRLAARQSLPAGEEGARHRASAATPPRKRSG